MENAMKTYISLLRGINVSGQKKIKMDQLKVLCENLGFSQVRTYIQSGNVIFCDTADNTAEIGRRIEEKIREDHGYDVTVIIRTPAELRRILRNNPFMEDRAADRSKLHVTFLSQEPDESLAGQLEGFTSGDDEFVISGREIYLHCPDGYGRTKYSNNFFEQKLKQPASTRNWRTVNKLLSIAESE